MEPNETRLECELLKRGNKKLIMGLMVFYILLFLFTKFLTPKYIKGDLVFKGLLMQYQLDDFIIYAQIFQILLLLLMGSVFWNILTLTLRIKGIVIISEQFIEVIWFKKFHLKFRTNEIKNLKIQFNYFKKNDNEPRDLVTGNNNLIEFTKFNKKFKFEFLIQTEEEDQKFRTIMEGWKNKNILFEYNTVLADF